MTTPASKGVRLLPAGDAALVVELGSTIDPAINARVLLLDRALSEAALPGVIEAVPTYRSLMVCFDPDLVDVDWLSTRLLERLAEIPADPPALPGRCWRLPVVYGGTFGEDLDPVSVATGLTAAEVIERHIGAEYRVYMIGFQPGFAYLGGLDPVLGLSRRSDPRAKVPAGSIIIGGGQAAVCSVATPSGWHLLGRTPVRLFDPDRSQPFLLAAGERVRFVPAPAAEWERLERYYADPDHLAELRS